MMLDLRRTLSHVETIYDEEQHAILVPSEFCNPGFWTVACALAKSHGIAKEEFQFADDKRRDYASAIGLSRAVWGYDDYSYARRGEGMNYSSIVHLDCEEATDTATVTINQCIRRFMREHPQYKSFVSNLCDVVGDLHDNVWSHGKNSGFSMAQKKICQRMSIQTNRTLMKLYLC